MRILHVITSLRTGGAEHLMVDLLPALKQLGHEVALLVFDGIETPFFLQLKQRGIAIHSLGTGYSAYHPKHVVQLKPYLKEFDVVHTHNTACQYFVAIAAKMSAGVKTKLVTTEHNSTNRRRGSRFWTMVDAAVYRQYNHIICISKATEENLHKHLPNLRTTTSTIHNGIDIEQFSCERGVNKVSKRITMVAAFRPQKDQDTVLRALTHLPPQYHLQLVGDGERRSEIEKLIQELGLTNRVNMMGVRTDIAKILAESHVSVLSSHWEGFGLAAAESMAAGTPVIASNVEGLASVVGEAGILFRPGDDLELARKIAQLCNDPIMYEQFRDAGTAKCKDYSIAKMAQGYSEVYEKL